MNTLKSISIFFPHIFQIRFILYYYVGKRKATHILRHLVDRHN